MSKHLPVEEDSLEEPLVNLTPLIDVVFVVLIAFMLIAPVLDTDHVELAPSGVSRQTAITSPQISLIVRADNTIWLRGKQISLAALSKQMAIEKKLHPGQIPQVIHDRRAEFGTYQGVKTALETAGFEQMDIVLRP